MIDLHVHTTCSDGEVDVLTVLKKAEQAGLRYLSITDHDCVKAYKELKDINVKEIFSGQIIFGVELSFLYKDTIMEVLGYGIDINIIDSFKYVQKKSALDTFELQSQRLEQLKKVCDRLGIVYSKDLKSKKPNINANDVLFDDIIKYPQNKDLLNEMNIIDHDTFYRLHYCNSESPFFIDFKKGLPTIFEVSRVIRDSGGKCFISHIFKYGLANPMQYLHEIINLHVLDGIECYHTKHSSEQTAVLEDICIKNNLLVSGGSDFHWEKDILGYCNRNQEIIPETILKGWDINKQ